MRIIDAMQGRDRVVWALSLLAGLRFGEIQALRWEHVDFEAAVIRVRASHDPA